MIKLLLRQQLYTHYLIDQSSFQISQTSNHLILLHSSGIRHVCSYIFNPSLQHSHPKEHHQCSDSHHPNDRPYADLADVNFSPVSQPCALRSYNIIMFDPLEHTFGCFIRRPRHRAEIEGPSPGLLVLPLFLKDAALKYHNHPSSLIQRKMNHDLAV